MTHDMFWGGWLILTFPSPWLVTLPNTSLLFRGKEKWIHAFSKIEHKMKLLFLCNTYNLYTINGFKYSYQILIIFSLSYSFRYCYLIIICTQLHGFKYSDLKPIICLQLYGFSYSYQILIIFKKTCFIDRQVPSKYGLEWIWEYWHTRENSIFLNIWNWSLTS